jgi:NADPH:quinone reductase
MKAVGLRKHLPIEDPHLFYRYDLDIQEPTHPTGHDLLVAIKAISVNPLDTKVRRGTIPPPENENMPRILGWDGAGEVIAVGSDCTLFGRRRLLCWKYYATRDKLRISSSGRTSCWKKTKIT